MSSPETERFVSNWNRIHKQTARALRAVPDDQMDWQPREGMFTMRQLVRHIPEAEAALARTVLAGSMQKVQLDVDNLSVAEIADLFDRQHQELVEEISKLTQEQLHEEIEAFGRRMRRSILLWGMTEHEIHHRGQLFTYLRLVGVEPPNMYA